MNLTSPSFDNDGMIPGKHTCDGINVSPSLEWDSVPTNTKSVALICDDPDAPMGTWVHWVYYDLPAESRGLPEDVPPENQPQTGGKQGINDFGKIGYGGPCPPSGTHRYLFRLYALDARINLPPGSNKQQLLKTMEGHILDRVDLIGKYKR